MAFKYGSGFAGCASSQEKLLLIIGVNNNGGSDETYAHGAEWAGLVNNVNAGFISTGVSSKVVAYAGVDIEPGFGSYEATTDWLEGYTNNANWPYVNFGSADGCIVGTSDGSFGCDHGWSVDEIFRVSGHSPHARAIPEIYLQDGTLARQWANIFEWGYDQYGSTGDVIGALTNAKAYLQHPDPTRTDDNRPESGWRQLWASLEARQFGLGFTMFAASDIQWWGDPPYNTIATVGISYW
jgi:hypothetical protein